MVTNDVLILAPFSYVMSPPIGRQQQSVFLELKSVSVGANRKNGIPHAL